MQNLLAITASPHLRSKVTTNTIMRDVLIALLPTLVAANLIFGMRALVLSVVCVAASVIFEFIYRKCMHLTNTIGDLSAAVTGLLLAYNLPVGLPIWMAVIGCFVSIVLIKQLFGGLGKNFANPAIVGRIVLLISFATPMTTWALPLSKQTTVDVVTGATPLAVGGEGFSYMDLFLGTVGGSMGETCKLTLLIGGIYLVARGVISIAAPLSFMATVVVFAFLAGQDPVFHLLAGGIILGALFMATDYVTTPTTEMGKVIFGIGCGIITMVIRLFAAYPEGVSFAILLMNIATAHIDRLCLSKPFGGVKA